MVVVGIFAGVRHLSCGKVRVRVLLVWEKIRRRRGFIESGEIRRRKGGVYIGGSVCLNSQERTVKVV